MQNYFTLSGLPVGCSATSPGRNTKIPFTTPMPDKERIPLAEGAGGGFWSYSRRPNLPSLRLSAHWRNGANGCRYSRTNPQRQWQSAGVTAEPPAKHEKPITTRLPVRTLSPSFGAVVEQLGEVFGVTTKARISRHCDGANGC